MMDEHDLLLGEPKVSLWLEEAIAVVALLALMALPALVMSLERV